MGKGKILKKKKKTSTIHWFCSDQTSTSSVPELSLTPSSPWVGCGRHRTTLVIYKPLDGAVKIMKEAGFDFDFSLESLTF